jgi:hypothetical protein
MAKLTFTITATVPEFIEFSDRLGYMTTIVTGLDGNSMPITAPNPEQRQDFLLRILKEKIASEFYTPYVTDINNEVRNQREADKETARNKVRNRVAVTFTP